MDDNQLSDLVNSERDVRLRVLNRVRTPVADACDLLTDEQIRQPGVLSGTNLLGIVQHLIAVERHWFQLMFLGNTVDVDFSMSVSLGVTRDDAVREYVYACRVSH